jgi:dihydrofolate synthase/folylpolyglutamate synthase
MTQPEQALAYLHGLSRPGVRPVPGLGRIEELLRRLDRPDKSLRTIHITGTNGKGSVAAIVASLLRAAGVRAGLFISPYLERFAERVVLDGQELPDDALSAYVPQIASAVSAMVGDGWDQPTEFEAVVALACLYYRDRAAEVISLEVGIGGRNDATNAIEGSLAAVITAVGMDHVERIGPTLTDIAREKSGIIRPGRPVVTGRLPDLAQDVVRDEVARQKARWLAIDRDFESRLVSLDDRGVVADVTLPDGTSYRNLHLPLLGRHQAGNLAVAVAAVHAARPDLFGSGGRAGDGIDGWVRRGMAAVKWPGRIEVLSRSPFIVLDGAHNADAVRALAVAVRELFAGRRVVAVIGSLADHAQAEVFASLMPLVDEVVVTAPPYAPRAMPAATLAATIRGRYPSSKVTCQPELGDALAAGLGLLRPGAADMMLVTGSFYLVGAARSLLRGGLLQG